MTLKECELADAGVAGRVGPRAGQEVDLDVARDEVAGQVVADGLAVGQQVGLACGGGVERDRCRGPCR